MLQRHQPRIIWGADHFVIRSVCGRPPPWGYIVTSQTLRVTNCIVLPGTELGAVQRTLQNPVSRPRGISSFDDDIGDLKDLEERHGKISVKDQWVKKSSSLERTVKRWLPTFLMLRRMAAYERVLVRNVTYEYSPVNSKNTNKFVLLLIVLIIIMLVFLFPVSFSICILKDKSCIILH